MTTQKTAEDHLKAAHKVIQKHLKATLKALKS